MAKVAASARSLLQAHRASPYLLPRTIGRRAPLDTKESVVYVLQIDAAADEYPDVIPDHKLCKAFSVHKHDLDGGSARCVARVAREFRGGDEHALVRPVDVQRANEITYMAGTDVIPLLISLSLNVDALKPERVLMDYAVHPPVA